MLKIKVFKKISKSWNNFKHFVQFKWKRTFPLTFAERKQLFKKRVKWLPVVIIGTYLGVSYLDYVLFKMSTDTFFSDAWAIIPEWIDFPVEEPEYEQWATDLMMCFVFTGGGYIIYFCLTLLVYEIQMFINKYTLYVYLLIYVWLVINDPQNLTFFIVFYMGSILCWGSWFFNWFFYWGWNFYQWALDLEEEMEQDDELDDLIHQLEEGTAYIERSWKTLYFPVARRINKPLSSTIPDNPNVQRLKVDMFKSFFSLIGHFYYEIMRAWDKNTEAEVATKLYGSKPADVEGRYRKHLYTYHWRSLFAEELRDREEEQELRRLGHLHREHYIDETDLYLWDYKRWQIEEWEDWENYVLWMTKVVPFYMTLHIFWRHVTEYRPWFRRPKVIGEYCYYSRRFNWIDYNKTLFQYYLINLAENSIVSRFLDFLKRNFNLKTDFKELKKKTVRVFFFFRKKWSIRSKLRRINLRTNIRKGKIDPFFIWTKNKN